MLRVGRLPPAPAAPAAPAAPPTRCGFAGCAVTRLPVHCGSACAACGAVGGWVVSGTCVPLCLWAVALRLLRPVTSPPVVVYVESVCRVERLSVSGRILYWLADVFMVQWKTLQDKCVLCLALHCLALHCFALHCFASLCFPPRLCGCACNVRGAANCNATTRD